MFKQLCVVIIALFLLQDIAEGKKTKKTKRPTQEDNAPQPDVVSYSTFGFNDVGTYEGFVPSSPDYTRFLTGSGANEESSTKQLPSSYPTSIDSTGYSSNFGQQPFDGQTISVSNDADTQSNFPHYTQNFNDFFNTPNFDNDMAQSKNTPVVEDYKINKEENNRPVYGTKIGSKNKYKYDSQFNHTDLEVNSDKNEDKYNFNFNDAKQPTYENRPVLNEFSDSFQNTPAFPTTSDSDFGKTDSGYNQNSLKFPRVVDFTKMKQFYPTELDTSHFSLATLKPESYDTSASAPDNNIFGNVYGENNNNKPSKPTSTFKEIYDHSTNDKDPEKNLVKSYTYSTKNNIYNYSSNTDDKPHHSYETKPSSESKKKLKNKPWFSESYNFKKWKDPSESPVNGYDYATNFSNTSFRYGVAEPKKPFSTSIDEVVPASSNVDFSNYQFPEMDYSRFKKIPNYKVHEDNEFDGFPSFKETSPFRAKPSPLELNQHKLFKPESTASSYWGNSFKSTDFPSSQNHANKHLFNDGSNDNTVNIRPKRPSKFSSGNTYESKPQDWSHFRRPSKTSPWNDWTKEVSNKFKSEEDLLGLRNHDTSLPSYLPNYQSSNNYVSDEHDYKKLVDKWRQSYLKSKYKESLRDYESYASEMKPMHVPVPKPYPIEVPHPIIVPVPQPYPVQVPVAKPVAVPVIREISVPIEKPVPYPVYKKVPYPIEKLVPVPVEKKVAVPVSKPYPVHVPYIRPVFHHTKSREEYDSDMRDDDDYFPRQETKKQVQYRRKKPNYNIRDRPLDRHRRPSRTVYQDRNRRRWPDGRRPTSFEHSRRPTQSFRHRDFDEGYDERSEYNRYCKSTGKC